MSQLRGLIIAQIAGEALQNGLAESERARPCVFAFNLLFVNGTDMRRLTQDHSAGDGLSVPTGGPGLGQD